MVRRTFLSVLVLFLCSVTACTQPAVPRTEARTSSVTPTPPLPPSGTPTTSDYVVTGQADGAPAGCSPADIAARAAAMFAAISQGDEQVVDDYFGQQRAAPFQWYSMTETGPTEADKNHFVAYTLDDLTAYFTRRYAHPEQVRLHQIAFNGWEAARGIVHFGPIALTRQADDLPAGDGQVDGKGAYHCATHAFIVLSLGMSQE